MGPGAGTAYSSTLFLESPAIRQGDALHCDGSQSSQRRRPINTFDDGELQENAKRT